MLLVFLLSVFCYTVASIYLLNHVLRHVVISKTPLLVITSIGLGLHAYLLLTKIITIHGLNFNLINSLSLTSLFFGVFFVVFSLYRPILSLGILALPTAVIGVILGYFGRSSYQPIASGDIGLQVHILLSFAAYCVLLMAAVQAVLIRLQIRELKRQTIHRFWVSRLPSLQSMESLLFDMILMGFVILSFALGFGLVATYDIINQNIAHKMLFSLLSWLIFGILIAAHYYFGWRGKRAANFTIYGFILLAVGFLGSKFVLEILL